jgi:hypothetical protein
LSSQQQWELLQNNMPSIQQALFPSVSVVDNQAHNPLADCTKADRCCGHTQWSSLADALPDEGHEEMCHTSTHVSPASGNGIGRAYNLGVEQRCAPELHDKQQTSTKHHATSFSNFIITIMGTIW